MLDLKELLQNQVIVADGAMGTLLHEQGIPFGYYDYANITHPEVVKSLHQAYVEAGALLIETNTFGANRFKLASYDLADQVVAINRAGVELAKSASQGRALVAGAVGPCGRPIAPIGRIPREEAAESFREQIQVLVEAGVDCLILETFTDLEELRLAFEIAQQLCDLPILLQKSFIEDGETLASGLPGRVAEQLSQWGALVIGSNCTVGPQRMLGIMEDFVPHSSCYVSAMPAAGLPQLIDGKVTYDTTPDYFAHYGRLLAEVGVNLIGGCCGTTPAHIRALAQAVMEVRPRQPSRVMVTVTPIAEAPKIVEAPPAEEKRSRIADLLWKEYIITVELDVPRGLDMSRLLEGASRLKEHGVHCIDISDGARARLRMSPIAVSYLIQEKVGIDVMTHFACRDRNLLAIQADLLGAHALGLRNILAITGDPAQIGDYPTATTVWDVDSIGLVRILRRLNEGYDLAGNPMGSRTNFLIAVAFNPLAPDYSKELERLHRKVEEGAQLVYTQPLYEEVALERAVTACQELEIPLIVGILPLRSARHAEFFHNEVPGIIIPERIRQRIAQLSDEDARKYGIEEAQRFLQKAYPVSQGVYLLPPANNWRVAIQVIEALPDKRRPVN